MTKPLILSGEYWSDEMYDEVYACLREQYGDEKVDAIQQGDDPFLFIAITDNEKVFHSHYTDNKDWTLTKCGK